MPTFKSSDVEHWFTKGHFETLSCRLGEFEIFCVDESPPLVQTEPRAQNIDSRVDTVLFIHGFPTSSFDFAPIWRDMADNYRLVTLDMLGFGFSDKPDHRQYTIHQQADLFESLIKRQDLGSLHIVAHDYGVSVAQELLARQIDGQGVGKWKSCTLLNGGLFPEAHYPLLIQKLMLSPLGKWINKFTGLKQFSRSFSSVFGPNTQPSSEQLSEFWDIICYKNGRHLFHNLITYILDRREHRTRWVDGLQRSPVPIALINGSVDPVSGAHLVERYKELNCRLDTLTQLPEIGHYPHVEAAPEVSKAILTFIANIQNQS